MTTTATTMRAVTYARYAGPDQMRVEEIPVPRPGDGEVRLRVSAAGLNPYDWHLYRGDPWFFRLGIGVTRPGARVLGSDVAGVVDAVGEGVTEFHVGDSLFGSVGFGACGEYAIGDVGALANCPTGIDALSAAALPMAAATALQAVRDAKVHEGDAVLVIGASGGVGHLAVQTARAMGAARIVAVCSGANAQFMERLGVDRVIDYRAERVEDCGEKFDAIIDTVATTSVRRLKRVMSSESTYVVVGALAKGGRLGPIRAVARAKIGAMIHRVDFALVTFTQKTAHLDQIAAWVDAGLLRPAIDGVYSLDQITEALHRLEGNHVAGKLVVRVA